MCFFWRGRGSIKITKNVRVQENGTWKSGQDREGSLKVNGAYSQTLFRTDPDFLLDAEHLHPA